MASWDRREDETPRQFQLFAYFRDLGPERKVQAVAEHFGINAFNIYPISKEKGWNERVDQWDAHLDSIQQRTIVKEVEDRSRQRARAYRLLLDRAVEALPQIDLSKATLSQVATAVKTAAEGMRLEDGLSTQRIEMETADAQAVISRLPSNVRSGLCEVLAGELGRRTDRYDLGELSRGMGPESEGEN